MTSNDILANAQTIVSGHRIGQYGTPENSFEKIAKLWSAFLDRDVSAAEVANMMILMKVGRNANGVYKDDNWIDICGYAAIGGELQSKTQTDNIVNKDEDETTYALFDEALQFSIEQSFTRWTEKEMEYSGLDADHFGEILSNLMSKSKSK